MPPGACGALFRGETGFGAGYRYGVAGRSPHPGLFIANSWAQDSKVADGDAEAVSRLRSVQPGIGTEWINHVIPSSTYDYDNQAGPYIAKSSTERTSRCPSSRPLLGGSRRSRRKDRCGCTAFTSGFRISGVATSCMARRAADSTALDEPTNSRNGCRHQASLPCRHPRCPDSEAAVRLVLPRLVARTPQRAERALTTTVATCPGSPDDGWRHRSAPAESPRCATLPGAAWQRCRAQHDQPHRRHAEVAVALAEGTSALGPRPTRSGFRSRAIPIGSARCSLRICRPLPIASSSTCWLAIARTRPSAASPRRHRR